VRLSLTPPRFARPRLPAPSQLAVPGSWGEQLPELRDYLGPAWHAKTVKLPRWAAGQHLLLRVGSANYACSVYVNGRLLGVHEGNALPFQVALPPALLAAPELLLSLRVEGLLSPSRVPPGALAQRPLQHPNVGYDFFPFPGIHRAVQLLVLPPIHLTDVTVVTHLDAARDAVLHITAAVSGGWSGAGVAQLSSGEEYTEVALAFVSGAATAEMALRQPRLWSPAAPHLYSLRVELHGEGGGAAGAPLDAYTLQIGIRTVRVLGDALLLNGKPLSLRGFGRHEDAPLSGRGENLPAAVRDAAAMRWCGANSYRTAHYPHGEASLDIADREGLAVISETPAVYLCFHDSPEAEAARLAACLRLTAELVARDKNRACVLLWSLANEPEANSHLATHGIAVPPKDDDSWKARGLAFFTTLFAHARTLDGSRPLTYAAHPANDMAWVALCDVVCSNRYNGWYSQPGCVADGVAVLGAALDREHAALGKPFVLSEFGADAVAGCHAEPPEMWSEEYQVEMLQRYLGLAAGRPWLIGFHVWNLTDFKTTQAIRRPGGINHKGVFTRDRRPKMAAHFLRSRWLNGADAAAE
jgi:beta-glucuronidase